METELAEINVNDILLDIENPRYHEDLIISGKKAWTQKKLSTMIELEDISDIYKSIKDFGILDPIWVVPFKKKFIVIEGNRRVVTLKKLQKENHPKHNKIQYDTVKAHILPEDIQKSELDKQRIILQGGKKSWSPFNVSSVITKLVTVHDYTEKEVGKMFNQSKRAIEKELENYKFYLEYNNYSKNNSLVENTQKYTYFQGSGESIRSKFFTSLKKRKVFFDLITEKSKNKPARIPTVALRGGLFRFNFVCQHDKMLEKFLRTPHMTVEEAIELIKEGNIKSAYPWLKQVNTIEKGLKRLNKNDIQKLKNDKKFQKQISNILDFCKQILG